MLSCSIKLAQDSKVKWKCGSFPLVGCKCTKSLVTTGFVMCLRESKMLLLRLKRPVGWMREEEEEEEESVQFSKSQHLNVLMNADFAQKPVERGWNWHEMRSCVTLCWKWSSCVKRWLKEVCLRQVKGTLQQSEWEEIKAWTIISVSASGTNDLNSEMRLQWKKNMSVWHDSQGTGRSPKWHLNPCSVWWKRCIFLGQLLAPLSKWQ